ncbi:MAG: DUF4366 domain-containing protein [Anaerolineaceae bacterium]|jgi:hypothetical protein|nr:DUF4366 domain-containing protein [Anaerolineaceae bacterium]
MKTNFKTLVLLLLTTIMVAFSLIPAQSAQAFSLCDEERVDPAPPTDAKGSLIAEMLPGRAILSEYSLVMLPMGSGMTPVPTEEPTEEATPRPPTDTYLEPPVVITAQPVEKEFFVIKTRNDKIFYLIIDRSKMSENVYLVTEVDEEDLLNFVKIEESPSLSPFLQPNESTPTAQATPVPQESLPVNQPSFTIPLTSGMAIAGAFLLVLGGLALFYWKVIKPKDQTPIEGDFFEDDFLEESPNEDFE